MDQLPDLVLGWFLHLECALLLAVIWYLWRDDADKLSRQRAKIDRLRIQRAHYDALLREQGDRLDRDFRQTLEAAFQIATKRYVEGQYRGIKLWRWARLTNVSRSYIAVLRLSKRDLKERLRKHYTHEPPRPSYCDDWAGYQGK